MWLSLADKHCTLQYVKLFKELPHLGVVCPVVKYG